jgi:serine/threonine protein kinase
VFKIVQESPPPIPSHYSPELRALVDRMLAKDPAARYEAEQVLALPFVAARLQKLALASEDSTAGKARPRLKARASPGTGAGAGAGAGGSRPGTGASTGRGMLSPMHPMPSGGSHAGTMSRTGSTDVSRAGARGVMQRRDLHASGHEGER